MRKAKTTTITDEEMMDISAQIVAENPELQSDAVKILLATYTADLMQRIFSEKRKDKKWN